MVLAIFCVAFSLAFFLTWVLIPKLRQAGIVGKDLHKVGQPEIPEMGGLGLLAGFTSGVLLAVALDAFAASLASLDLTGLLATLGTVLLTGLIGIVDDLLGLRQVVKAFLPVIAALPLVAIRAGHSVLTIPFWGQVDFGIFYPLLLVPLGVTGAANAVNMLAGFNGAELGMGIAAMAGLAAVAWKAHSLTALALLLSGMGASLGVLFFNWYPARVFIGDVGTLSIGAILAASCIVGNFETAGLIVIVPYVLDFLIKAAHRFPSQGWSGELQEDGRLYCPQTGPVGLGQAILKLFGGLHERTLTLLLIALEVLFAGLAALLSYWH